MTFPTLLFGLVGHPLGHSLSPLLHNWAFGVTGTPGLYMAWPLPPEKLADFFVAARTLPIRGGNITLPHKVAAAALVDRCAARARAVGAINTFFWKDGLLWGDNTDVSGFMAPLRGGTFRNALVLGAGGVARAVLAGLAALGVERVTVTNRTASRARALAADFGVSWADWGRRADLEADCVINTTSLGMRGEQVGATPYPAAGFRGRGLAYDLVYTPLETRFLREAAASGWAVQTGLTMFVEQARESFRLWTGTTFSGEAAEHLLREALCPDLTGGGATAMVHSTM